MGKIIWFRGDHAFLSNFYPATVRYGDILYPTCEHAFQAQKADPKDVRFRKFMASVRSPAEAKMAGREWKRLRKDWDQVKDEIMKEIRYEFYNQHPDIKEELLDTGDDELIEGNDWHDNYWGICFCGRPQCKGGRNKLGKIHTELREYFYEGGE